MSSSGSHDARGRPAATVLRRHLTRVPSALATGIVIGSLGGVLELLAAAWNRWVLERLLFQGSDYWWLTPLLAGAIVAGFTAVAALVVPARWETGVDRLRFGVPIALGTVGVLWLFPQLALGASLVLAAGVGVTASAWCARRAARLDVLVRRTLPLAVLIPTGVGIVMHLPSHWLSRRSADGAGPGAPNVLLLVLDTVRAIELGLYGLSQSTSPTLDGLGAGGVVFERAVSPAPWSAPSHASLFTGRSPAELSIDWNRRLDATYPTLAEALRDAGYATVGIVANTAYASAETGLARGFDHYEDYPLTLRRALAMPRLTRRFVAGARDAVHTPPLDEAGRLSAEHIAGRFLAWVDDHPRRPFFAFLNFYDAHAPYGAPEPFWSRYLPDVKPRAIPVSGPRSEGPAAAAGHQAYRAAIAHLDFVIGNMLDTLIRRGVLNNTLVIVTADHGEEFNEHAVPGHGQTLFTQAVHVPLLLFWPGRLPAARVSTPVGLAQLPATIMDLLHQESPFPGTSVAPLWRGDSLPASAVASMVTRPWPSGVRDDVNAPHALESVQVGRYHYIRQPGDAMELLYDQATDPLESRNLARQEEASSLIRSLRDSLAAAMPAPRARRGGYHDD